MCFVVFLFVCLFVFFFEALVGSFLVAVVSVWFVSNIRSKSVLIFVVRARESKEKTKKTKKKENSFITVIPFTPMNDEVGISSYNIRSFIKRMDYEKKVRDQERDDIL